jgi:hypothetical protein
MLRDLKDAWGWIQKLVRRVERLESGAILENSSITSGRMRFIGGLLLIDEGGTLQVIGHLTGEGDFQWVGPWKFNSPSGGEIAGDVDLSGNFRLTGNITVLPGGKIQVGNIIIDPSTAGGQISLGSGRTIDAGSGYLAIRDGSRFIVFNSSGVSINAGGPTVSLTATGMSISGLPTRLSSLANAAAPGSVWLDGSNQAYKIIPG